MYVSYNFSPIQVFQFSFIDIEYLISHFKIILVRRRTVQFDFSIATFY